MRPDRDRFDTVGELIAASLSRFLRVKSPRDFSLFQGVDTRVVSGIPSAMRGDASVVIGLADAGEPFVDNRYRLLELQLTWSVFRNSGDDEIN